MLVNCVGIVHVGKLHEYDEEACDYLIGVNAKAIFISLKYAVPHLLQNAPSYVVNVASVSSLIGQGHTPTYTVSKHTALGLTRLIALYPATEGQRCNYICSGIPDTPMLRYHLNAMSDPDGVLQKRLQRVPMGVAIQPEDLARGLLF